MATSRMEEVEGLVIRASDYRDSSKILKIFTRDYGMISVMARGAKRPKSKMQNLIAPLSISKFDLVKGKKIIYLDGGDLIDLGLDLRGDLKTMYFAFFATDLVEASTFEGQVNVTLYDLLKKTLSYLPKVDNKLRLINMFMIKFISFIGYRPILARCVSCGKKDISSYKFSIESGGILCQDCSSPDQMYLDEDQYQYLLDIMYTSMEDADGIDKELKEDKAFKLLLRYILVNTELRSPKSYDTLIRLGAIR